MKQATTVLPAGTSLSINDNLAIKVAERLGLLEQELNRLKAEGNDERLYYTYGMESATISPPDLARSMVPQIIQKLSTKKYMLVVDNLYDPIRPIKFDAFTEDLSCLPPPRWKDSFWLLSPTSYYVYEVRNPNNYCPIELLSSGDNIVMLTLYSLHQAAKYILGVTRHKDEQYWHHVAIRCFRYVTMLLIPHRSLAYGDGDQQSSNALTGITSDELIRQWAAQGIITVIQNRIGEVTSASYHDKYNDIYQVGNVILEAFREYSLLQLPVSPATKATISAAQLLACKDLFGEFRATSEELCEDNPGLEHMQRVSNKGDQGWNVRIDHWSSYGPTQSLIIRHCSQQSRLFAKLDHLLAKLPFLRVLDLSYSSLESLPTSICYFQKLLLLSLRGCYNLKSPFSFPDTERECLYDISVF